MTELEYLVWKANMLNAKDHDGAFEYYRCTGTNEVWIRGATGGMTLVFVIK